MADKSVEELTKEIEALQLQINDLGAILDSVGKGTEKIARRFI